MRFCKKCNKEVGPREDYYKELCINCYNKYLSEKLHEMAAEEAKNRKSSIQILYEKITSWLKK